MDDRSPSSFQATPDSSPSLLARLHHHQLAAFRDGETRTNPKIIQVQVWQAGRHGMVVGMFRCLLPLIREEKAAA